jgi:hypothetical protein
VLVPRTAGTGADSARRMAATAVVLLAVRAPSLAKASARRRVALRLALARVVRPVAAKCSFRATPKSVSASSTADLQEGCAHQPCAVSARPPFLWVGRRCAQWMAGSADGVYGICVVSDALMSTSTMPGVCVRASAEPL